MKKLFAFKKKLFYKKLTIGLIIIASIPTFFSIFILYHNYSNSMVDKISNANIRLLGQMEITMDMMIDEMLSAANNNLCRDMRYFCQTHFTKDSIEFNRLFDELNNLKNNSKYIDSIYVYFDDFDYLLAISQFQPNGFYNFKDFKDKGWYELYQQKNINKVLVREALDGKIKYLTLIKPVLNYAFEPKGVMVINISESKIFESINKIKTDDFRNFYITDSEGNILFCEGNINLLTDKLKNKILTQQKEGYIVDNINNEHMVISFVQSDYNGWNYITVTPVALIIDELITFKKITIIIAVLVTIIAVIISIFYSKYLYKPILRLLCNIKDNQVDINEEKDEFQTLDRAFKNIIGTKRDLEIFIKNNKDLMKEKILNNIILGYQYEENVLNNKLKFLDINFKYSKFCVLLIRNDIISIKRDEIQYKNHIWQFYIISLVNELFISNGLDGVVFETNFENIAVIINYDKKEFSDIRGVLDTFCDQLQMKVAEHFPFSISIGIGKSVKDFMKISTSYNEAKKALNYLIVLGRNKTIFIEDIVDSEDIVFQVEMYEKKIKNCIQTKDLNALNVLASEIISEYNKNYYLSRDKVLEVFIKIIFYSMKAVEAINIKVYEKISRTNVYVQFMKNKTLEDISEWLNQFFQNIIEELDKSNINNNNKNSKIEQAENYVINNYKKDLTLTLVAEKVGLNASYFSKIFKEETGKNFTDYLNMIRVEKSKELMYKPELPLYEIANMVGFNNDQSYTRYFKKYEGCTPGKYREIFVNYSDEVS